MRVLGITETCDLGSLYLRLIAEDHEVRVAVSDPLAADTMAGLVSRTEDWRAELPWVREAGTDGLILFEAIGFGALQDDLRRQGFNVIGGSAFGDRLENDRAFALQLLAPHGMRLAPVVEFSDPAEAIADLRRRPRRCVFKRSASAGETFVGSLPDGTDIVALLSGRAPGPDERFVLMDHVEGVETGVGAYFNGERFLRPACVDWDYKRTVATYDGSDRIFEATLAHVEPLLRDGGHVGYVNLNTIINADGIWPIEFTCRFGYPGFAVLEPLQAVGWGELFRRMISRDQTAFGTHPGWSLCVVLTTPPFPHSRREIDAPVGLPVIVNDIEAEHLHLGEVGLANGQLVTSGLYGWTAVVTGTGATVAEAKQAAYSRAALVQTPNLRYRLDIGDRQMTGELEQLQGWIALTGASA